MLFFCNKIDFAKNKTFFIGKLCHISYKLVILNQIYVAMIHKSAHEALHLL